MSVKLGIIRRIQSFARNSGCTQSCNKFWIGSINWKNVKLNVINLCEQIMTQTQHNCELCILPTILWLTLKFLFIIRNVSLNIESLYKKIKRMIFFYDCVELVFDIGPLLLWKRRTNSRPIVNFSNRVFRMKLSV